MINVLKRVRTLQNLFYVFGAFILGFVLVCPKDVAGFQVIDQAGRKVEFKTPVNRVVSTYKPGTSIIFSLGGQGKLLHLSSIAYNFQLLAMLAPQLTANSVMGSKKTGINIEAVLAANPDMVILYPSEEGIVFANKLTGMGIPSIVIKPESFTRINEAIDLLGRILGLEEKGGNLKKRVLAISDLVAQKTVALKNMRKLKVYYAASRGITTTSSASMMQHEMIEMAGGMDVASDTSGGWINVSVEQLYSWDPDIIFLSATSQLTIKEITHDRRLSEIKAVKTKRIFKFPCNLNPWDYPSAENYLAVLWMSIKMYPALYTDLDFSTIVEEYYLSVYSHSFSALGGILE